MAYKATQMRQLPVLVHVDCPASIVKILVKIRAHRSPTQAEGSGRSSG